MKKCIAFCLLLIALIGCGKDEPTAPPKPVYVITGSWNIYLRGATTYNGILNITSATSSNFVGTLSMTGFGQLNIGGTLTSSQIHFSYRTLESVGFCSWELDGTYNLSGGSMSGTCSVIKESDGIKVATFTWDAQK
jgi:hypothetical protein